MMTITVADMTCGHCGIKGHTKRSCETFKAEKLAEGHIESRRKSRQNNDANKRFTYQDCKQVQPFVDALLPEGKEALMNGRRLRSNHFKLAVKPETAVSERLIEPYLAKLKKSGSNWLGHEIEWVRESAWDSLKGRKKYMDYEVHITPEEGATFKWLIEVEAPNQTHKGLEQVNDFLAAVPNVSNDYGFIVTDGFHWHICPPPGNAPPVWNHTTADSLWGRFKKWRQILKAKTQKVVGMVIFGVATVAALTYTFILP